MSSKSIVALLTSAAIAVACIPTDGFAQHHGGWGGGFHGGFSGFHGGFHGGPGFAGHWGGPAWGGHAWGAWHGPAWGGGWGRWGWGHGWGWGGGWGWAGPVFWPFFFANAFAFAFWPYSYYDPFWALGPDFVLGSMFAPGPYAEPGYPGPGDVYYGGTRPPQAKTGAAAAPGCATAAPGVTDFPAAQISKVIKPTTEQTAALDDLKAATAKANDIVKASCPSEPPLTPVARLDTATQRLTAIIQAVDIVREPLEKFYNSLSEEQKQRLDKIGGDAAKQAQKGAPAGGNLAALCGREPGEVAKLPAQRIEEVVKPTTQQQETFDELKQVSRKVAEDLQASCPKEIPQAPVARLDAVKTRLAAIVEAMNTIRPKLAAFYDSLSDEQKAKFNTLAPPRNPAAPQLHSGNQ